MRSFWKTLTGLTALLGAALLLATLLGLAVAATRIALYEQIEDEGRLANKRAYLEGIAASAADLSAPAPVRPNIIVVLFDDLGYEDLSSFGARAIRTPAIDQLAAQGTSLTNYYAPAPVCTPSRASLLTGRYPVAAGLPGVAFPSDHLMTRLKQIQGENIRLPADEVTISEVLEAAGYRTGMVGKWHLGDSAPSLPNDFGFNYFYGSLYSNDMPRFHLYENREMVEDEPDQPELSRLYASKSLEFIDAAVAQAEPFFLYLAHHYPHIPLFASPAHAGESAGGLYGDVVEDLDRSMAQLIQGLQQRGLADNTLIMVTSDNGPWFEGSAGDVRGRKGNVFDGGQRVPFIAWWPGNIPANTSRDGVTSGVDLFPTLLELLRLPLPDDRDIHGRSMLPLLLGTGEAPPRMLEFYAGSNLFAVREGRFKYHVRRPVEYNLSSTLPISISLPQGPWLFDLSLDRRESYDLSTTHPQEMQRFGEYVENRNRQLKSNPRAWQ